MILLICYNKCCDKLNETNLKINKERFNMLLGYIFTSLIILGVVNVLGLKSIKNS